MKEEQIRLIDMVMCLSNAIDLVSTTVYNHHKRVAYIASGIATQLGLTREEQENIIMAGALHDIGAMFLAEDIDSLGFETGSAFKHAEIGYFFLNSFEPLSGIAPLVRYHHIYWHDGKGEFSFKNKVPLGGHIIHLADRVEVSIKRNKEILGQINTICENIKSKCPEKFRPDVVNAFLELAQKESFWLELISPDVDTVLAERSKLAAVELNIEAISDLAGLFSQIIDFRSRFTAVHSSGVAVIAETLAGYLGWTKRECRMIRIAGNLHDLGKLAVPLDILEKHSKLSKVEFNYIKAHTFYTHRTLANIGPLKHIAAWASFHHERLDGHGYPFHRNSEQLCLGARIIAVADVFTAITEDRPYRQGMTLLSALKVLRNLAKNGGLDANIVAIVEDKCKTLDEIRIEAQKVATEKYQNFTRELDLISRKSLNKV